MDFWHNVFSTISRNRRRSFFTAFGVFWGIMMLVALVGFGSGTQRMFIKEVGQIAANSCFFFASPTNEAYKGFNKGRNWNLSISDLQAIKQNYKKLKYVSGIIFAGGAANNTARNDRQGTYSIMGFSPEYNKINPSKILQGRYINEIDIREQRKVCVIGEKILNDLYLPSENAVGSLIRINGVYYKVVGVMQPYSQNVNIFGNLNEMIALPFSTLQLTMNLGKDIHCIAITASNSENIEIYEKSITTLLKERNTISPTDTGGVEAFSLQLFIKPFMMLLWGVNILVWFVGLGTLLAGIIGISNIMMITVRERTQEIGVLRALGATPVKIITQIMCESVVLTIIAGIIGIMFGVGILSVIGNIINMDNFQISFSIAMSALGILILGGLLAGLLPSSRALKIKAIDALRDE